MPNAESATLCFPALHSKFRIAGVLTIKMMTIISKKRFQRQFTITLKELGL